MCWEVLRSSQNRSPTLRFPVTPLQLRSESCDLKSLRTGGDSNRREPRAAIQDRVNGVGRGGGQAVFIQIRLKFGSNLVKIPWNQVFSEV